MTEVRTPPRSLVILRRTAAVMACVTAAVWILRLFGVPGFLAVLSPVMAIFGVVVLAMVSALSAVLLIRAHRWLFPR